MTNDPLIAYWAHMLDESHDVVNALIQKFGHSLYDDTRFSSLSDELAHQIYNLMNTSFFDKPIDDVPMFMLTASKALAKIRQYDPTFNQIATTYGYHFTNADIVNDHIRFSDNIIIINTSNVVASHLITYVATILHEMLHQYDQQYGEFHELVKFYITHIKQQPQLKINEHSTPTFQRLMKTANSNGINVIEHVKNWEDVDWESFHKWLEINPLPLSEDEQPVGSEWITTVDDKGRTTGTCRRISKTRYALSHFDLI